MARQRNTDVEGAPFSERVIDDVWRKGATVRGKRPAEHRCDPLGNIIRKDSYGKESGMGW